VCPRCNTLLVPLMCARKTGGAALHRLLGGYILSLHALPWAKPLIKRNGACWNPIKPLCFRPMPAQGSEIKCGLSIVAGLMSAVRSMNGSLPSSFSKKEACRAIHRANG
jgi:hypothetical protein